MTDAEHSEVNAALDATARGAVLVEPARANGRRGRTRKEQGAMTTWAERSERREEFEREMSQAHLDSMNAENAMSVDEFMASYADGTESYMRERLERIVAAAVAEAVGKEQERGLWHINEAVKFYDERIDWCNRHPGNDATRATSEYTRDALIGVAAAIRARSNGTRGG